MLLLVLGVAPARAQQVRTASAGSTAPAAKIDSLAWLAGSWSAPGLGGPARETYSPVMGSRITGHFVQEDKKGNVAFSELVEYVPVGTSIAYRVRHFAPDMSGWEDDSGKPVVFPLIAIEGDRWYFDGMTLDRTGPDAMTMWVRIDEGSGARDVPFHFTRGR